MAQKINYNYLIAGSFVALIFLTIIFVTMILPATTFQPEQSEAAIAYTPSEKRGRDIYRREGCFYCHSQFTRYQDRESGEMVKAGDYVFETPHILGTERTGPDLSNVGGKYPDGWHHAHHINPRKVKPGSIMPSYSYLTHQEMDDLIAYLQTVGRDRNKARFNEWVDEACQHQNVEAAAQEKCLAEAKTGKLPKGVHPITWIEPPQEFRDVYERVSEKVDANNAAIANSGRGIFMQNCAVCHGVAGKGNGPISKSMTKKPANFTRPYYTAFSDAMWFYRVSEGVAGTRMPRWNKTLSEQDIMYLVAYLKTLPRDGSVAASEIETVSFDQLDDPKQMEDNYKQISELDHLYEKYAEGHSEAPVYGGGRH